MNLTQMPNGSFTDSRDPGEACYSSRVPRVSVTTEEAEILAGLVRGLSVLELGTGIGVSTRALASTAASVLTVDIDPWVKAEVWPGLVNDCPNVRTLGYLPDETFDVVFIDANHDTSAVKHDIEMSRSHCRKLMLFHDVKYNSVRAAVDAVFPEVETFDTAHGLGLVRL